MCQRQIIFLWVTLLIVGTTVLRSSLFFCFSKQDKRTLDKFGKRYVICIVVVAWTRISEMKPRLVTILEL
ncbi:unnamed protein product [Victoria cruziana]